jgi:hypothetical protein
VAALWRIPKKGFAILPVAVHGLILPRAQKI